jgi:outer membrane protein TolC
VTAERNLQQARSTLVSTRADLLVSAAELAFAAGAEEGRYRGSDRDLSQAGDPASRSRGISP